MKGYLTIFLSLSLSLLTGFLLLLIGSVVNNGWKIRLEGIMDVGMNSVLGEYSVALHERYGLFYVDASYKERLPSLQNMEERLSFYMAQNLEGEEKTGVWGNVTLTNAEIAKGVSAAAGEGKSMKRQAVRYIQDCGVVSRKPWTDLQEVFGEEDMDAEEAWRNLMEQIAQMELPKRLDQKGEWEEIPLSNPADSIFAMLGSDVLYLTGVDINRVGIGQIRKKDYISERKDVNFQEADSEEIDQVNTESFLVYLSEVMGDYRQVRENSLLQFQLEYIAKGEASDYENLKEVVRQLIRWRFVANIAHAMGNEALYNEAAEMAQMLTVVQMNPVFGEPVTKSILYACAYLESIRDVRCLLTGGRIPADKSEFVTQIGQVLTGEIAEGETGGGGFSYEDYLLYMIGLLSEDKRNLRTMDIMEMDIRKITGNSYFAMDFCVERYTAEIHAKGAGNSYRICRTYGYF